jgi:hypothetical protein
VYICALQVPYFESVHNVNSLTFFDDELSTDYLRPIDATEARVFDASKSITADRDGRESPDGMGGDEDEDAESPQQQQQQSGKRIDQEGFTLNSFFQKAK